MALNLLGTGGGREREEEEEEGRSVGDALVTPFIPQLLSYLSSVVRGEGRKRRDRGGRDLKLEFSLLAR